MSLTPIELEDLAAQKTKLLKEFFAAEPPEINGDQLVSMWDNIYDDDMKSVVVETASGPSDDCTNYVFPYEKICAVVGDGGNWKWPRMWQRFDDLERRGAAYRDGEPLNYGMPNKNPNIVPQKVLIVGGGPVGLRCAIEMRLGGHQVTVFEKRREIKNSDGSFKQLGFTNRINRPHMWPFVRNDLARLNGKEFMSRQAAYPVFTEPDTTSIGIDELQVLLLKNAFLLGVDFRFGVSYDDATPKNDPKTCRPSWHVECTYDAVAAQKFGCAEGKNVGVFDVLIGCDGPRSTVRDTQAKIFGDVEKRKFMDAVGIVVNVRKVSRKRLRDLGFDYGQEPSDMNRTKLVFKDFFAKINREADADLENLIYYKASFHNYCILTPKRSDLVKHGLSGKVYTFSEGREGSNAKMNEEKVKLNAYCSRVLKAAGIPVDPELPNNGFVDAPNDCMAFDFAEVWNTKSNMVFNLPPADYSVDEHGAWQGRRLIPLVGLAGDALLEPFWPMGLGLKRGWQAIMDTCYAVDNLYNRTLFCHKLGKDPCTFGWDDHYEALREQISRNFEYCTRLLIADDMGKGEYADSGIVMQQLRKKLKDVERPLFEVEIDPWTRYAPLSKEREMERQVAIRLDPSLKDTWVHPVVQKVINMKASAGNDKDGSVNREGKKLVSVGGKSVGTVAPSGYKPKVYAEAPTTSAKAAPKAAAFNMPSEVAARAQKQHVSLKETVLSMRIEEHVQSLSKANSGVSGFTPTSRRMSNKPSLFNNPMALREKEMLDAMGNIAPKNDSVTERQEAMWNLMHERHLSPAKAAELVHVRLMIEATMKSLDAYKQAEKELLMMSKQ